MAVGVHHSRAGFRKGRSLRRLQLWNLSRLPFIPCQRRYLPSCGRRWPASVRAGYIGSGHPPATLSVVEKMLSKLAILLTAALCGYASENDVAFADGVPQYCQESCPEGWTFIDGLQHCYRLGNPEDPRSNVANFMDADTLCRSLGGSLPEADNMEELELLNSWVADTMLAVAADPAFFEEAKSNSTGLWWGYARRCYEAEVGEVGYVERRKKENFFSVNSPSARMPCNLWRFFPLEYAQPRDEAGINQGMEEACVARRKLYNNAPGHNRGLDDYPCSTENFVVCMKPNIPNLQQRCMNPDLMGTRPQWKEPLPPRRERKLTINKITNEATSDPEKAELVIDSLYATKPRFALKNETISLAPGWDVNRQCKA